ncbi:MAG: oligosaccharide flippase family protein [Bacteroidales bacterium]|nr:oligosaccharide flippase family protein [Bacteroidales bacterium]
MANNEVKKLAGQTAIYGGTTVLSRLLNYLLVPLHTYLFSNAADYGVVGELYAWTSLFIVILTYGMETAFFRFSQDEGVKDRVYSTVVGSLLVTSTLFIVLCSVFAQPIADWLRYPAHPEYVRWFSVIIGVDALTSIFFAHLRFLNKALRFAAVKLTNILVNVLLNLFFLLLCPWLLTKNPDSAFVNAIYNPEIGVGYIFIANLVASVVTLLMLFPGILKQKFVFDWALWKKMFRYAFPLLIFGLAGIVNETMDRVLIKRLSLAAEPQASVGIYSACYKISILMTIVIQAFKYAAEPFFFRKAKDKDAKETYAEVMTLFVLVCSVIFTGIMLYMDIVQYFVGETYRVGLPIVPILLMANLFLGIFYNLSIWYKLTGQTKFGAYIAIFGAVITLVLNWLLIPRFDYMGAAWTTFACYLSMMVVSYLLGQKYYHVDYDLKRILFYLLFAVAVYGLSVGVNRWLGIESVGARLAVNTVILIGYLGVLAWMNREMVRGILRRK